MVQETLARVFASVSGNKESTGLTKAFFEGENFFFCPVGKLGAAGINFDPCIGPESRSAKPHPAPRLILLDTRPESDDACIDKRCLAFEISRGGQNLNVRKSSVFFMDDMKYFKQIIEKAEVIAREQVRV